LIDNISFCTANKAPETFWSKWLPLLSFIILKAFSTEKASFVRPFGCQGVKNISDGRDTSSQGNLPPALRHINPDKNISDGRDTSSQGNLPPALRHINPDEIP
jgi:hypothetical protein